MPACQQGMSACVGSTLQSSNRNYLTTQGCAGILAVPNAFDATLRSRTGKEANWRANLAITIASVAAAAAVSAAIVVILLGANDARLLRWDIAVLN